MKTRAPLLRTIQIVLLLFLTALLGLAPQHTPAAPALQGAAKAPAKSPASINHAIEQARAYIRANLADKVPGLSIAVERGGRVIWVEGFGFADIERKIAVTPESRFRIGSVSKPLTAAGLMLLVEQGQLDLDAPIQKYVPDFPDKGHVITTRLLAGHLAGIRHYNGAEFMMNQPFASVHEGLKIFENDPLLFTPGEKYSYSSYGWNLISAAMEGASGENFLDYMQSRVFRKLRLSNTCPDYAGQDIPSRTAFYQRDDGGKFVVAPPVDNSYKWAGGGFLSTPSDLVRFGSALLQPGFLQQSSLDAMFTSQRTRDGKETGYGIGWGIAEDEAKQRVISHGGGSVGGTTTLMIHPATRTVMAVTINLSGAPFRNEDRHALLAIFTKLPPDARK